MACRKCPHHVRHGQAGPDGKSIEFKERCGLQMKDMTPIDCAHHPFASGFDYQGCEVYISTFQSEGTRNDVIPTSDFQYSEKLASSSITDMDLL